jgi:hypothetical protein
MRSSFLRALLLIVPLAVAASGCNNSTATVTTPTPTPVLVTDKFEGALTTGGSNFHLLTVKTGDVITTMTGIGPDPTVTIGMSIGVVDSTGLSCTAVMDNPTSTIGSTLKGTASAANTLCVKVYDAGTIATGVTLTYALTVTHYQ